MIFGRQVTSVVQFQAAFDAFPATGTWTPWSAYERSDGETRGLENDPLLGIVGQYNQRDPQASAPVLPSGAGPMQVPICLREHGIVLRALLGNPVTSGSSPNYTHVFESGKDTIPTLAQSKKLATGWYRRTRGLCFNTYAINLQKESGYPRATLGAVLRDEIKATAEVSGTIAAAATLLRVPASKPFAKYATVAMPVTAFSLNYSNQMEPNLEFNDSEYPNGFDAGDSQVSASFTVRLNDPTWDDLADAMTPGVFEMGWQLDANKSITYKLNAGRIARVPNSINTPGRLFKTYDVIPEQTASAPALTVTLKTDVASY